IFYGAVLITNSNATFKDCTFKDEFNYDGVRNNLEFNSSKFLKESTALISNCVELLLDNCTVPNPFLITKAQTSTVKNSNLLKIEYDEKKEKIGSIAIQNSEIEELHLKSMFNAKIDNSKIKDLLIYDGISALSIFNSEINELYSEAEFDFVTIHSCEVKIFNIGYIQIKRVDISDSIFDLLTLSHITYKLPLEITNTEVRKEFNISGSSLESARLLSLSLTSCKFVVDNTVFLNCSCLNIKWPAGFKIYENEDTVGELNRVDRINMYESLRESYRQLKFIMKQQADNVSALGFFRNEMNIYWEIVKLKRAEGFIEDYIIVGTNKLFSDFGRSLIRPAIWLVSVHIVLINFLFYYHPEINISASLNPDWKATFLGFRYFFYLINPIHSPDVGGINLMGFIDFLMRFSSGLFIYYIIRASRKYGGV
ncbi:hypothetical protein, partial [Fulvivirga sp.]|uniref:hypothetical protein n=1 Tax=Fulvivirga sp. TaxID=1931237 RepID=UPI0032EB9288